LEKPIVSKFLLVMYISDHTCTSQEEICPVRACPNLCQGLGRVENEKVAFRRRTSVVRQVRPVPPFLTNLHRLFAGLFREHARNAPVSTLHLVLSRTTLSHQASWLTFSNNLITKLTCYEQFYHFVLDAAPASAPAFSCQAHSVCNAEQFLASAS